MIVSTRVEKRKQSETLRCWRPPPRQPAADLVREVRGFTLPPTKTQRCVLVRAAAWLSSVEQTEFCSARFRLQHTEHISTRSTPCQQHTRHTFPHKTHTSNTKPLLCVASTTTTVVVCLSVTAPRVLSEQGLHVCTHPPPPALHSGSLQPRYRHAVFFLSKPRPTF